MRKRMKISWTAVMLTGYALIFVLTYSLPSIWQDEGYTAMIVDGSWHNLVVSTANDVHPPLYYLVLKGWMTIFGHSLFVMRGLSAVSMMLAAVLASKFVGRFVGDKYKLWVLGIALFGPVTLRYGQEMRMYGFAALLAVAATWLFMELLYRNLKGRAYLLGLAGYALLVSALLYTHYFSALLVPVHGLVALTYVIHTSKRKPKQLLDAVWQQRGFIVAGVVAFCMYIPWLPILKAQRAEVQDYFWIGKVHLASLLSTISTMMLHRPEWREWQLNGPFLEIALVALVVVLVLLWQLIHNRKIQLDQKVLFVAYLFLPMAILYVLSRGKRPLYFDRYFVTFAPVFYAALAIGLKDLWDKKGRVWIRVRSITTTSLVICFVFGYVNVFVFGNSYGQPLYNLFLMRSIYSQMKQQMEPQDLIVSQSLETYFDVRFYATRDGRKEPLLYAPGGVHKTGSTGAIYVRQDIVNKNLDDLQTDRFWFTTSDDFDLMATDYFSSKWAVTDTVIREGYGKATLIVRVAD